MLVKGKHQSRILSPRRWIGMVFFWYSTLLTIWYFSNTFLKEDLSPSHLSIHFQPWKEAVIYLCKRFRNIPKISGNKHNYWCSIENVNVNLWASSMQRPCWVVHTPATRIESVRCSSFHNFWNAYRSSIVPRVTFGPSMVLIRTNLYIVNLI